MEKEVSESVERTIRLLHTEVNGYFDDMVRLSTTVMTETTLLNDDRNLLRIIKERNRAEFPPNSIEGYEKVQRLNYFLDDMLNRKRDLDSVYLYTKSGAIYASHRSTDRIAADLLRGYENRLLESGREWIVEKDPGKGEIYLIRRINDPSHQYLGCIVLSIGEAGIQQLIRKARLPKQDILILWNRQLPVLDPANKWAEDPVDLSPARVKSLNRVFPSGSALVTYASPNQSEWSLVAYLPYKALTEEIRSVRFWIMIAVAACVLMSILVAALLAMGIVKPVKIVRNAMRKMEKGFLNTRVRVRGKDEVAELAAGFNSMSEKLQELIDRIYLADLAHKEAELRALQAQINPHFLYNTLEAITMVAEMQRSAEAAGMARALGLLFRASTEYDTMVPVRTEIMLLKQYLLLQEIRFDGTLRIDYDIAPEAEPCPIPKLSLQTIAENCFKHGFAALRPPRKASLKISAIVGENDVSIEITDNGIGMESERLSEISQQLQLNSGEGTRVGLLNVHKRIRYLWGKDYGLRIASLPGIGTTVTLIIPYVKAGYSE